MPATTRTTATTVLHNVKPGIFTFTGFHAARFRPLIYELRVDSTSAFYYLCARGIHQPPFHMLKNHRVTLLQCSFPLVNDLNLNAKTQSMPTPSYGVSPSEVASLFRAWKFGARIIEILYPPVEVTDHFDKLYQLEEVPSALVQGPLPTPFLDNEPEFQLAARTWASTLRPVEGDEYGIIPALPSLALAHKHFRKMLQNHSKAHTQRHSINAIIELAFSARLDRHCDFKTEESYRIVAFDGIPDAQSDALVTLPSATITDKINIHRIFFQGDRTIFQHLYWSSDWLTDGFSIIGFAGEFKTDDDYDYNKNQLIMVLATAQAQRKALSLKQSIIMGAIVYEGRVQIFSSYWTSDESILCIHAHEQRFQLSNPIQVIRLYVFCSKLEKHFQDTLALELKTWNIPTETTLQSRKWRSPDHIRKRRRTEAGESCNGSINDGPVEADDDRYMNVMKWRDEVVKDGNEGRDVSEEDNLCHKPTV